MPIHGEKAALTRFAIESIESLSDIGYLPRLHKIPDMPEPPLDSFPIYAGSSVI